MGAREDNLRKCERWRTFEWFEKGLQTIVVEANKAKDDTKDEIKLAKLEGFIGCATRMRDAIRDRWGSEAKKCAECNGPRYKPTASKFCSAKCRNKWRSRSENQK